MYHTLRTLSAGGRKCTFETLLGEFEYSAETGVVGAFAHHNHRALSGRAPAAVQHREVSPLYNFGHFKDTFCGGRECTFETLFGEFEYSAETRVVVTS